MAKRAEIWKIMTVNALEMSCLVIPMSIHAFRQVAALIRTLLDAMDGPRPANPCTKSGIASVRKDANGSTLLLVALPRIHLALLLRR